MTPRKNKPKSRNKNNQKDKKVDKEIEEKARQETEEKINTDTEDKAQLIIRQAEDKSRSEAETRSKEITKEAEDKAQLIIRQAEDKSRSEAVEKRMTDQEITKIMDYYPQEEPLKLKENNYHENNKSSNPFIPGFSLWQDYAKVWMDLSKEITSNTTAKMIRYFENTNEKS